MAQAAEVLVPHRRLFDAELANDVGTVKPGAKKLLECIKSSGKRAVIVGEIAERRKRLFSA